MNNREREAVSIFEKAGYQVFVHGWPDFLLMLDGKLTAVEYKSDKDHPTPRQRDMHAILNNHGIRTVVVYESDLKQHAGSPKGYLKSLPESRPFLKKCDRPEAPHPSFFERKDELTERIGAEAARVRQEILPRALKIRDIAPTEYWHVQFELDEADHALERYCDIRSLELIISHLKAFDRRWIHELEGWASCNRYVLPTLPSTPEHTEVQE